MLGKADKPYSCLHTLARSGAQIPHADDFVIPSVCPYVRVPAECSFWTEQSII
jgi:hypothetical protein